MITVTLKDHLGTDLDIVNAARNSFDKESNWVVSDEPTNTITLDQGDAGVTYLKLSDRDKRLLAYMARGLTSDEYVSKLDSMVKIASREDAAKLYTEIRRVRAHELVFAQGDAKFQIRAPLSAARQLWKSHIGLASQDDSLAWNEVSYRYIEAKDYYRPTEYRKSAPNVKQGSSHEVFEGEDHDAIDELYVEACLNAIKVYERMLAAGACKEQSRNVLPQSMMTMWTWKGSLLAFSRICKLRLDPHTQLETQIVAEGIAKHMSKLFPVSWSELMAN